MRASYCPAYFTLHVCTLQYVISRLFPIIPICGTDFWYWVNRSHRKKTCLWTIIYCNNIEIWNKSIWPILSIYHLGGILDEYQPHILSPVWRQPKKSVSNEHFHHMFSFSFGRANFGYDMSVAYCHSPCLIDFFKPNNALPLSVCALCFCYCFLASGTLCKLCVNR